MPVPGVVPVGEAMNERVGINPFASAAVVAEQVKRPIVNVSLPRDGSEQTRGAPAVGTGAPPADASCAEQRVRFPRRGPLLQADDWAALRDYARLLGQRRSRTPHIPAPVSDEQWDRDLAVDSRDWCND